MTNHQSLRHQTRALVLIAATSLSSCGSFVTTSYYEVTSDQGKTINEAPNYCSDPRSTVEIELDQGIQLQIQAGNGPIYLAFTLLPNQSLRFQTSELVPLMGWPANLPPPKIGMVNDLHLPTEFSSPKGNAPIRYMANIEGLQYAEQAVWANKDFSKLEFILPIALINGKPSKAVNVKFQNHDISYYKSFCWK